MDHMKKLNLITALLIGILLASCSKTESPKNEGDSGDVSYSAGGDTIYVTYNGTSVSVVKPVSLGSVSVTMNGGDVTVNSTISDTAVYYCLKGATSDGMFKIYSDYKFNLIMNGVSITNLDGPAIDVQSGKKCTVLLNTGTFNTLTDGSSYATTEEDEKAALFSEGPLEFKGDGNLTVKSLYKHAICSDDNVDIQGGIITISGAVKDGIHTKGYFEMSGGALDLTTTDDGIECEGGYVLISGGAITTLNTSVDVKGISCDSTMVISGGTINMTVSGNQSKGLKSGQNMTLSGGTITINTSGAVGLTSSGSGYDPSYCSGIKCDSSIIANGANITIISTGAGGKGISSDKNTTIKSGIVKITTSGSGATYKNSTGATDSYSAACISADGNICILGGSLTTKSTGTGGKGLKSNGTIILGETGSSPDITITTSGAKFVVSGSDYCHPKAIVSDVAVNIYSGTIHISSSDDGIHAENSITQYDGNVTISNSYEAVEAKYITIKGGSISAAATNDGFNATAGLTSGGTEQNDGSLLTISGGIVSTSVSSGDGFDSNGAFSMSGGTAIIQGPSSSPEVAIDINGSITITGGFLVAAGPNSGNMIQTATSSTQYFVKFTYSSLFTASALFHIQDASGTDLVTFQPVRNSYYILFTSPSLAKGSTYYVYTGGSSTGTNTGGLYTGGTYSGGTNKKSFSLSNFISSVSL
jgi:hypothetical protein